MNKAIMGKKIGMTQIFDEKGRMIPVTVVEATPNVVVQIKLKKKKVITQSKLDSVKSGNVWSISLERELSQRLA